MVVIAKVMADIAHLSLYDSSAIEFCNYLKRDKSGKPHIAAYVRNVLMKSHFRRRVLYDIFKKVMAVGA